MKKISKNLLYGFGAELILFPVSIIIPRIILVSFGSEVNGVAATITQIFTYIALLEAGIGNASLNCLYKNIADGDRDGISTTVSATRKYFRRVVPVYALCVAVFALVYPMVAKTDVSAQTIRLIIAIQGLSGIMNISFTNTYMQLILADGRSYVSSNIGVMSKAISVSFQLLLIGLGFDIVSVQLSLLLANIVVAIVVYVYVRRVYPWLKKDPAADIKILAQRGALVVHHVSWVIFQSTDVFIISIFCSMKEASVYTIYNMVYSVVKRVSDMLFAGINFRLGVEYHRDRESYKTLHDTYEVLLVCVDCTLLAAVCVVILPFIRLYTAGVTDVNYILPVFPILFSLVEILSMSRMVAAKLITVSGGSRNTISNTITESAINLTASLVLVNIIGIHGVLLGTVAALLYRTNDMILYANLKILKRKPWRAYKTLLVNLAMFATAVVISFTFPVTITGYVEFFLKGALTLTITAVFFVTVNCMTDANMRRLVLTVGTVAAEKTKKLREKHRKDAS